MVWNGCRRQPGLTARSRSTIKPLNDSEITTQDDSPLRLRGVVVGIVLITALAWLVPSLSFRIPRLTPSGSNIAWGQIPTGPFIMLVLVAWLLRPLLSIGRRRWFAADGLLSYAILLPATIFASVGGLYYVFGLTATPFYPVQSPPQWAVQVLPHIPSWLLLSAGHHPQAIMQYYEGVPGGLSTQVPWGLWAALLYRWGGFLLLYYYTMLSLTGLFRRRWFRQEHITFPLAELALTVGGARSSWNPKGQLLHNKLLWIGFAIPFIHGFLIMLGTWLPAFPDLWFHMIVPESWPKGPPWNAVWITIYFRWLVMGIAYVLPLQISNGVLFFYFAMLAQTILLAALGYTSEGMGASAWTVGANQGMGGALIFVAFFFWTARRDLGQMWRDLLKSIGGRQDNLHPDRWSIPASVLGTVGMIIWSHYAGLTWHAAALFVVILLALQLCTARIEATLGMPHCTFGDSPDGLMRKIFGARWLGAKDMPSLMLQQAPFWVPHISSCSPMLLQSHKIADVMDWDRARFKQYMMVGGIAALVTFSVIILQMCYKYGGVMLCSSWYWGQWSSSYWQNTIVTSLQGVPGPQWRSLFEILTGGGIMWGLVQCYHTFIWWPFHPLAYPLGTAWTPARIWAGLLPGWACKQLAVRLGGHKVYRQLSPLFIGLVIGELGGDAFWGAVSALVMLIKGI